MERSRSRCFSRPRTARAATNCTAKGSSEAKYESSWEGSTGLDDPWARKLGISYTPSIVLFDAGKEAFRIEAYVRPFHLAGALDYVASGAYRREPSFQRFVQARGERMRGRGEPVDLWK